MLISADSAVIPATTTGAKQGQAQLSLPVVRRLLFLLLFGALGTPVVAQKEIPKAEGHDQCPLGYVNTLGTTCVSPIYYEVAPTNGEACKSGWMNIGMGYCKKKKGPLGIL